MEEQSIFRRFYNFFGKNWLVASFIGIMPGITTICTSIIYHEYIALWGKIALIVISVISMCFVILKNYGTKEDMQKCVNADRYYKAILNQAIRLKKNDAEKILELLENEKNKELFQQINLQNQGINNELNPKRHIENYCYELTNLLADSFGTSADDVGISIIYGDICSRTDININWQALYNSRLDKDVNYKKVIKDPRSTFSAVVGYPEQYYFKEKENAEKERRYIRSPYEMGGKLKGSIYCQNISICGNEKILPILFTVTTYDSKICSDNEKNDIEKAVRLFKLIGDNIAYEVLEYYLYVKLGFKLDI